MTTNISDLIRRVLAIAPLPHTAAEPRRIGYAPIVGSNGRILGWIATTSGDWRAVAELWAQAPAVIPALTRRIMELEAERDRYHDALKAIHEYCEDGAWPHGVDGDDGGSRYTCDGRYAIEAMASDALEARNE